MKNGSNTQQYEVLISLDTHLQLNGNVIELAGVTFIEMNESDLSAWGIDKKISPVHELFLNGIVGNSVALMHEQCSDRDTALKNARAKLGIALDTLRVALLIDHNPRIVGWRIPDQQLLFHAGEKAAIKEQGGLLRPSIGFRLGFRPVQFAIDAIILNQIAESKKILDSLFVSAGPRQSHLKGRICRAMEWIGDSATRERLDDRLIDICTALETLLTSKQDRKKGEAIALRMTLLYSKLDKPFSDPAKLLELYEKRSDVIHGSHRDIFSESDYKFGQWEAVGILVNLIIYIGMRSITRHSGLLRDLVSDSTLVAKAVAFWENHPCYADIAASADEMLKMYTASK